MAVRVNASGESIRRTAGLPSSTAFTMCGWARLTRRSSQYQFWGIEDSTVNSGVYALIGYDNNAANNFQIVSSVSGGFTTFTSSPTDETWFFWAITCEGAASGQFKGYWCYQNESTFKTASANGASFTPALMSLGNDSWDEWCNGAFAHVKVYSRVLSSAELLAEKNSATPVSTTGLYSYAPLPDASTLTDSSGNGNHWTGTGSLSTEASPTFGGGGHTIANGQIVETNTAQPLAKRKIKTIGQVTELDTAQAIGHPTAIAIGQITETDNAQALARAKYRALGQIAETDGAQHFTAKKIKAFGQATETDTALHLTQYKSKAIGQVTETESARALARVKNRVILQVTETDIANPITNLTGTLLNTVEETDIAQALWPMKRLAIAQTVEVEFAQPLRPVKRLAMGQVVESESAQALAPVKIKAIGQALEIDQAQPLTNGPTGPIIITIGQVVEVDVARPITRFVAGVTIIELHLLPRSTQLGVKSRTVEMSVLDRNQALTLPTRPRR